MRSVIVCIVVVTLAGGAWFARDSFRDRSLPAASRVEVLLAEKDAALPDQKGDEAYGWREPYDCRRTRGDASVDYLVDDVDFICTPRKVEGDACDLGECAGFVVDLDGDRIIAYKRFGGG